MKKVGIIGWRGMVGSVLIQRMQEENNFNAISTNFFSTSQAGQAGPQLNGCSYLLKDALSIDALAEMDIIISCQGGGYTTTVHTPLRATGWNGYWIDAASSLRMHDSSTIVLDPINAVVINKALDAGAKDFIGGNCTVSLMLMGIGVLFKENLIDWVSSMTYQAASGAGAKHMKELLMQMNSIGNLAEPLLTGNILELDKQISHHLKSDALPVEQFGQALALNLIPWIDTKLDNGQSREEFKAMAETNKILGNSSPTPIDGTCVRIGALRSHSQGLTIKLNKSVDIKTIDTLIQSNSEWTELIPNEIDATKDKLNPCYTNGTLRVAVGRVRKMAMGNDYLNIFTVGDQLLWGAAEPLRRMLNIILDS